VSGPCALGVDPGGTSGLFLGAWAGPGERKPFLWRAWQCDMAAAPELLNWILSQYTQVGTLGIEAFDARERSRKMRGFSASTMRKLVAELEAVASGSPGVRVATRPPSLVKPWATDKRLAAAGLIEATSGMPAHARDGARHMLYAARHDCGLADPLSRARD
jgi:hypothetical protein